MSFSIKVQFHAAKKSVLPPLPLNAKQR